MSEVHVNGIAVTLTHLDEVISTLEQWARGRETRSVLYREHNGLSARQRSAILKEIAGIRRILEQVKDHFRLVPKTIEAASDFRGHCAILWENLLELEGARLKRYGEPPADLVAYIDPKTEELIRRVDRISDIACGKAEESPAPSVKSPRRIPE